MTRVASWNVNSLNVRLPHVQAWLAAQTPDVLALQETKLPDDRFPSAELMDAGYHSVFSGQKTYNGVAILARTPPEDPVRDIPNLDDPQRRILAATVGDLRVINLYVVNGQAVGSDKYRYKLDWLSRVTDWIGDELARHEKVVVVGDFNITPDDRDVHDPEAWHEKILCSTPEREALQKMMSLGLDDTFRLFDQPEEGRERFSWWDYRAAAFRRNLGLRIDLVLASKPLVPRCISCAVDLEPRRQERPSDHAPVYADFEHG